jgi:hypothetical protein
MAVQARLIAVSTHSSNVKPRFRETADFARAIYSQVAIAMSSNRVADIGVDLVKSQSLLPRRDLRGLNEHG